MDGMPTPGNTLPSIGDEIAGKYRVETVVGQGGMGAVYSARNILTGKRVALKWLLPEHAGSSTRERLLREARIACSIEHPNVVDIYDVGEHQGGLFLVMEYLRGQPLSDVLAERGRLDPDELIALLVPTMRGVHAAHLAGVIHRDLKPENIILSESDGELIPKVVDFGVSKTVGGSSVPNSSLTRTGALVGTPHYMALEQVDGTNQIDARTDVYAFGVLLYRALTGHYPFDGTSLGEVILKIGTKDAAPLRSHRPELPVELDLAVMRTLSRNRDLRFRDLEELAAALEPFSPGVRFHRDTALLRSNAGGSRERLLTPNQVFSAGHDRSHTPQPSADGYADATLSAAYLLRGTPAKSERRVRPVRAFWLGAGVAFLLLSTLAVWSLRREPEEARAEGAALPVPAAAIPSIGAAQTVPARATQQADAQRPEAPKPATPEAPRTASALLDGVPEARGGTGEETHASAGDAGVIERSLGADTKREGRLADGASKKDSPAQLTPVQARRVRRETRRQETQSATQRIPGERTKGLSADDF